MKPYERNEAGGLEHQTDRYKKIDELNQVSFLMTERSTFQVVQSLHSAGAPRDMLSEKYVDAFDMQVVAKAQNISRRALAGNMSPLNGYGPAYLTSEERIADARNNIKTFLTENDVDPRHVRILRPERDYTTPLSVINLDDAPLKADDTGLLRPDQAGDMLYTYDPEVVMAVRPADCPVVFVSAETPKGAVTILLHLAWLGVANGYIEQAKKELDTLHIDWPSARVQITPGAHANTYTFDKFDKFNPIEKFPESVNMFVDFHESTDEMGKKIYSFGIDVAAEVYEQITNTWDVAQYNIFADTSNTTAPESGYSSHSRSFKNYDVHGENSRDLVLARRMQSPNL